MRRFGSVTEIKYSVMFGLLVLGLIVYFFAVADRYEIFLYNHVDNPGDEPTMPFGPITTGRYWMSGFVAVGLALIASLPIVLLEGHKSRRSGRSPLALSPLKARLTTALIIGVGVPIITMTQNQPVLPAALAAGVVLATLAGVGLALVTLARASRDPKRFGWSALDGLGIACPLIAWRAIELPALGTMSTPGAWMVAIGSVCVGFVWLRLMTRLRKRLDAGFESSGMDILFAGIVWVVLIHPAAHYLFADPPGIHYITSASNIFSHSPWVWLSAVAIGAVMAWQTSSVRRS